MNELLERLCDLYYEATDIEQFGYLVFMELLSRDALLMKPAALQFPAPELAPPTVDPWYCEGRR